MPTDVAGERASPCQNAIRARVTGRATVDRKRETIRLQYECEVNTRTDKLISASYDAAD
ncbi:MAG TPA: hypothetical protein VNO26_02580 [Candidatus Limnocylindria bacterium]|nr:hypothetical protein [Candidatus Limnocylindria bacterium]